MSFCITLEHYKKIIKQAMTLGKKGGRYIGFDNMNKHYIGKSELEGLIRSGYIGTYSLDCKKLDTIFELVANGYSNNTTVVAFKERLEETST